MNTTRIPQPIGSSEGRRVNASRNPTVLAANTTFWRTTFRTVQRTAIPNTAVIFLTALATVLVVAVAQLGAQTAAGAAFEWKMEPRFGPDKLNNYTFQEIPDTLPDYLVGRARRCVGGTCPTYAEIEKLAQDWPDRKAMDAEEWLADRIELERQIAALGTGIWVDAYIFPAWSQVSFQAREGVPGSTYIWTVDGTQLPQTGAHIAHAFRRTWDGTDETHTVTLSVRAGDGQSVASTQTIVLKDLLVVSIGDSVASGEGNPHVETGYWPKINAVPDPTAVWQDTHPFGGTRLSSCHRSMYAGPALAAAQVEASSPHSSVTFVHLACSGASIEKGLLGPWEGQERGSNEFGVTPSVPNQIWDVARLVCPPYGTCENPRLKRPIDALLVSIGANDIELPEILRSCMSPFSPIDPFKSIGCKDAAKTRELLTKFRVNLERLADVISRGQQGSFSSLPASQVYITEYADPTHKRRDEFCSGPIENFYAYRNPGAVTLPDGNPVGQDALGVYLSPDENAWAFETIFDPASRYSSLSVPTLNGTIRLTVDELNDGKVAGGRPIQTWHYVGGIADQFLTHGYCVGYGDTPTSSWFRTLTESVMMQFNWEGSGHPNHHGHLVFKNALVDALNRTIDVGGADATPPALVLPPNLVVEATSAAGAVVVYTVEAIDFVDGPALVRCTGSSGFIFPLGATQVNCSASDQNGNMSQGQFLIHVVDTTGPRISHRDNLAVAAGWGGATVNYVVDAIDAVDGRVPVTCTPLSGSFFPIGRSDVACQSVDLRGNRTKATFSVTVSPPPWEGDTLCFDPVRRRMVLCGGEL
jgi:hypothetical protein